MPRAGCSLSFSLKKAGQTCLQALASTLIDGLDALELDVVHVLATETLEVGPDLRKRVRPDRVGISPLPYGRVYGSTVELYASTALKCPRGTWGGTGVDVNT